MFLFSLLVLFFKHLLYLSTRMESCDLLLRQKRKPLLDTRRYWPVYPHEKVTLLYVTCQKHKILAPRLLTFSLCRLVKTITKQLSCILCLIRVCMMRDTLYVLVRLACLEQCFKNIGDSKIFFLRKEIARIKC